MSFYTYAIRCFDTEGSEYFIDFEADSVREAFDRVNALYDEDKANGLENEFTYIIEEESQK